MTPDRRTLFDPGLQVERTALAWRRTGLALTVLAVGGARTLCSQWGAWTIAAASVGIAGAVAVLVASHVRHRTQQVALMTANSDRVALPGGALPAALALFNLIAGFTALAFTIAQSIDT